MSCNHCNSKFNFFHKEAGCSNCGLSFCRKCVNQKCKIPAKASDTEFNVCRICFSKLTSSSSFLATDIANSTMPPPPDAFLKRLESLKNPSSSAATATASHPITMYSHQHQQNSNTTGMESLRTGLAAPDQDILNRLEKLKASDSNSKTPPPSEHELRRRLATLKGENEYVDTGPNKLLLFKSDTRSDQQKTDSLLEQFIAERDIELARNPQVEIEARLATLREQGVKPNQGPYVNNLHDSINNTPEEECEDEEIDKITRKIMDEVALDVCTGSDQLLIKKSSDHNNATVDEDDPHSVSPDLPWCVLCNKDAKFRCLDCGGDLYCSECNIECHRDWEKDHKIIPFKP